MGYDGRQAEMAELVDANDSKSFVARREGSSPSLSTTSGREVYGERSRTKSLSQHKNALGLHF